MEVQDIISLSLVCHHFRWIFQPVVFSRVEFGFGRDDSFENGIKRIETLNDLLAIQPRFEPMIKEIVLTGKSSSGALFTRADYPLMFDFVEQLGHVEHLIITSLELAPQFMEQVYRTQSLEYLS